MNAKPQRIAVPDPVNDPLFVRAARRALVVRSDGVMLDKADTRTAWGVLLAEVHARRTAPTVTEIPLDAA